LIVVHWAPVRVMLPPDTAQVPFGDVDALAAHLSSRRFAAFVIEPIQAESGISVPDPRYLETAQALCRRYGTLFVLDEVQTGMNRTGPFLAAHHFGLEPDMVVLAKALLNEPELMLLDEPTASLDPDTADYVRGMLEAYRLRTGTTILLASHNMSEVERLCDDVIMLRAGKLVDRGTPVQLLTRYGRRNMEEVFIDIARERRLEIKPDGTPGVNQ